MSTLRTIRLSLLLLAMAMVQLLVSPMAAYAAMSARGSLLQDVCSTAPVVTSSVGDTRQDEPGLSQDAHRCLCLLCAELPPLPLASQAQCVLASEPQGFLQVGNTWLQPGASAHKPPSTGPPHSA